MMVLAKLQALIRNEQGNVAKLKALIRNEQGNVESSLVLIPLIFLFLTTLQVIVAIEYRNIERVFVQSEATTQAIEGDADSDAEIRTLDRFGNVRLLIIRRVREIPTLVPGLNQLFGHQLTLETKGAALIEEVR